MSETRHNPIMIAEIKRRFAEEPVTRMELSRQYSMPRSNIGYWCRGIEKRVQMPLPNRYEVRDDKTILFVRCKGELHECLIDNEDLEKVQSFPYAWHGAKRYESVYVFGVIQQNRKILERHPIHRFLMNPPSNMVVDHINGNPLDNRKSNLRIVTNAQNMQNRKINKNSTTGVRGVQWVEKNKYYRITCKNKEVARAKTLEEATKIAVEVRKKYMPYSEN